MIRITTTAVFVDDQDKALDFSTRVLGFAPGVDVPVGGGHRWLTVVSPAAPDGTQLLLEPEHPAAKAFKAALVADGIPLTSFGVDDVHAEYERLTALGVRFLGEPTSMGQVTTVVLDDTCGNLIQIASVATSP